MGTQSTWAAFVGHDAGHMSVFHNKEKDDKLGVFVGNFMTGVGIGFWKYSHNTHHIMCNSIDSDPDIQHMPFLACNPKVISQPYMSTYFRAKFDYASDVFARFFVQHQDKLMYPLVFCFGRYNLYVET